MTFATCSRRGTFSAKAARVLRGLGAARRGGARGAPGEGRPRGHKPAELRAGRAGRAAAPRRRQAATHARAREGGREVYRQTLGGARAHAAWSRPPPRAQPNAARPQRALEAGVNSALDPSRVGSRPGLGRRRVQFSFPAGCHACGQHAPPSAPAAREGPGRPLSDGSVRISGRRRSQPCRPTSRRRGPPRPRRGRPPPPTRPRPPPSPRRRRPRGGHRGPR